MGPFSHWHITSARGLTDVELTALIILGICLALSLALNAVQFYRSKHIKKELTQDAKDLLHDLCGSSAVLEIRLMDKSAFFMRSPNG